MVLFQEFMTSTLDTKSSLLSKVGNIINEPTSEKAIKQPDISRCVTGNNGIANSDYWKAFFILNDAPINAYLPMMQLGIHQ